MSDKKTLCIYCSSSNDLPEKFYKISKELGVMLAEKGYNMVYGGSTRGMMGTIADNALKNGAEVIGVMPEKFQDWGLQQPNLTKLIITKDMRERKATMEKHADAFIAMPGGFGTFEEIFEILVAKQLSYHNKPVIFMNFDGYYDNMFKMFDTVYQNSFAKEETKTLYFIANTLEEMFDYIQNYQAKEFVMKW
jgi:uncharacterized protein (TIGR00730 family)